VAAKTTPAKKTTTSQAASKAATKKSATTKSATKKTANKKAATTVTKQTSQQAATRTAAKTAGKPAAKTGTSGASAKKAPAASLAVKSGEGNWTKSELNEVVKDLTSQRDKLAAMIDEAEAEIAGLMRDAGDGAGHDQADMGATSFERDYELTVVNNEREMLAQIDNALAHIDAGTYGICDSCGQAIGKNRLMAFPRATLCLSCKQREERR